jgi:hypothetical protein
LLSAQNQIHEENETNKAQNDQYSDTESTNDLLLTLSLDFTRQYCDQQQQVTSVPLPESKFIQKRSRKLHSSVNTFGSESQQCGVSSDSQQCVVSYTAELDSLVCVETDLGVMALAERHKSLAMKDAADYQRNKDDMLAKAKARSREVHQAHVEKTACVQLAWRRVANKLDFLHTKVIVAAVARIQLARNKRVFVAVARIQLAWRRWVCFNNKRVARIQLARNKRVFVAVARIQLAWRRWVRNRLMMELEELNAEEAVAASAKNKRWESDDSSDGEEFEQEEEQPEALTLVVKGAVGELDLSDSRNWFDKDLSFLDSFYYELDLDLQSFELNVADDHWTKIELREARELSLNPSIKSRIENTGGQHFAINSPDMAKNPRIIFAGSLWIDTLCRVDATQHNQDCAVISRSRHKLDLNIGVYEDDTCNMFYLGNYHSAKGSSLAVATDLSELKDFEAKFCFQYDTVTGSVKLFPPSSVSRSSTEGIHLREDAGGVSVSVTGRGAFLTPFCEFWSVSETVGLHPSRTRPEVFTFLPPTSQSVTYSMDRFYLMYSSVKQNRDAELSSDVSMSPNLRDVGDPSAALKTRLENLCRPIEGELASQIDLFNNRYSVFGYEHFRNEASKAKLALDYEIITIKSIKTRKDFRTQASWLKSLDFFYLKVFEYLYTIDPKRNWALIDVTGDGSCFFHAGSANIAIMQKLDGKFEFYDYLRNRICDVLRDSIDDGPKKQTGDLSFMHYYQMQCMSGVTTDAIQPHPDIYMDYLGEIEPQKKKEQSDKSFEEEKMAFPALLIERKAIVRRRILEHIEATRTHGSFNTEQQVLAFAILINSRVKPISFDGLNVGERPDYIPDKCTDPSSSFIPMIRYAPPRASEHWLTAVSLDSIELYSAPLNPPMTTDTHDGWGIPRTSSNPCPPPTKRLNTRTATSNKVVRKKKKEKRVTMKPVVVVLPFSNKKRNLLDDSCGAKKCPRYEDMFEVEESKGNKRGHIWCDDEEATCLESRSVVG